MTKSIDESKAIEIAENVIDFWTGLKNDNHMTRRDFVLILEGRDEAVDATVLKLLPVMLYKRKKEKCIVASAVRDEEFVKKHADTDVDYRYVSGDKIKELCMLPSSFWLFDDIVIDSFIDAEDIDGFSLCGEKGITIEDVIATGFLSLTYTPTDEQIYEARKYLTDNKKENISVTSPAYSENDIENMKADLKKKILIGKQTYYSITESYKDTTFLLSPFPGSGDIYLISMYINEYVKRENIKSYILLTIGKGLKKVADLFGVPTAVITKEEMDGLFYFGRLTGIWKEQFRVFDNNMYQRRTNWLQGLKNTDYNTMMQRVVFKAPSRIAERAPYQESADELLAECGCNPDKIVLIGPYANTLLPLPDDFWPDLVKDLNDYGYTVFTNTASVNEAAIEGTKPLFVPYNKLVGFVDNIAAFIGLRSGLCDIMSSTKGKMIVLYTGKMYSGVTTLTFFGIKNMGLKNDNIYEIDYGDYVEERKCENLRETIMKYVRYSE